MSFGGGGGSGTRAGRMAGGPTDPNSGAPIAPNITDPNVQAAGDAARANAAAAFSRYTTILTSGQGDTKPAPAIKKTLLGGIA